ncbi:hypothetical protein M5D96_001017 [Drosophila gunungcola]|uniref:Uncharacterized protein n=1 Tax=Drosophila gunungcola TaxID=103775 RepID=A0A9Q0BUA6_9MUSC|nr:hypothetical protein M5D96_001017 [Drosophila gunungcola]
MDSIWRTWLLTNLSRALISCRCPGGSPSDSKASLDLCMPLRMHCSKSDLDLASSSSSSRESSEL